MKVIGVKGGASLRFLIKIFIVLSLDVALTACTKEKILSDEKDILNFSLENITCAFQWEGQTLYILMHDSIDISKAYIPQITVSEHATVYPPSGMPQIFSYSGARYIVKAQSGNSKEYIVKVRIIKSGNEILEFKFPNISSRIESISDSIIHMVVFDDISLENLSPEIVYSEGAQIFPLPGIPQNFQSSVKYTVTAQDGSIRKYKVLVEKRANEACDILQFDFPNIGHKTIISDQLVFIELYEKVDITKLTPNIKTSEYASVAPSTGISQDFTNEVLYEVTAQNGTKKTYRVQVKENLSDPNNILSFSFPNIPHQAIITNDTIYVDIYTDIPLRNLAPMIEISDKATIYPASGVVQNFKQEVKYTVTSESGVTHDYIVKTQRELSNQNKLLSFAISGQIADVKINGLAVTVTINGSVDKTRLVPLIKISENATVDPLSGIETNFASPVTYTVTAQDGTIAKYIVAVNQKLSSEKEILSFNIPNKATVVKIEGQNITVDVYENVDITRLTPIIQISKDATINPSSGTTFDFSHPVNYVVTSQDGNSVFYTVTVNQSLSRKKEIESFKLVGTEQILEREGNNLFVYVPYETDITSVSTEITVSDKATVSPESGVQINFTNPQIYTVTASNGGTENYLVSVKKSPWRNVIKNGEAPFLRVDGHSLIVFKDKMWLIGGWLGKYENNKATYVDGENYWTSQVWCTSDGINWESKGNAPWNGRHGFGCVVFDNKIWVIGGDQHTDVWNSEDGMTWNKILDIVPWGKRYFPYVVSFKGKIWTMGGQNVNFTGLYLDKYNDIWSTTDGINWVREVDFVNWVPRGLMSGTAVLNDELFILGGSSLYSYAYNDIWKTIDGITWTQVTNHAEWGSRSWHSVASYNNKLWIMGGDLDISTVLSNEVWYSSEGRTWMQQKGIFWEPRHAAAAISFKDKLWMVGGLIARDIWGETSNDVWMMDIN